MNQIDLPSVYAFPGMRDYHPNETDELRMERIIRTIGTYLKLDPDVAISNSRKAEFVYFRQLCMFFIRRFTCISLVAIAKRFGNMDHTTVIHSCQRISDFLSVNDEKVLSDYNNLKMIL